ncbi:MAG: tetraacyldisaccharide 4'-kinase [Gammaproteobacteria bacterium]|nr:tetraacyldisaccharide 4'-kinase [Gammaproteobacteria bacterium]
MAIESHWYRRSWLSLLLWPLSQLFALLVWLRRLFFRWGWLKSNRLPVPLVVVGNLSVGGTGKTPLVVALAKELTQAGYRVGIISRGYGGQADGWPQSVSADSEASWVGDEPLLIARRSDCPMSVGANRYAAGLHLLARAECDLILADDGLQHYALQRDFEIVVLDGERRLGNGWRLPAGPLRESAARLRSVDWVLVNGARDRDELGFDLHGEQLVCLSDAASRPLADFIGQRVHAVAAIGHPARFFAQLCAAGLEPIEHPLPDHHVLKPEDVRFEDDLAVMMTEKDAVKCQAHAFRAQKNLYYLPVTAELDQPFITSFLAAVKRKCDG